MTQEVKVDNALRALMLHAFIVELLKLDGRAREHKPRRLHEINVMIHGEFEDGLYSVVVTAGPHLSGDWMARVKDPSAEVQAGLDYSNGGRLDLQRRDSTWIVLDLLGGGCKPYNSPENAWFPCIAMNGLQHVVHDPDTPPGEDYPTVTVRDVFPDGPPYVYLLEEGWRQDYLRLDRLRIGDAHRVITPFEGLFQQAAQQPGVLFPWDFNRDGFQEPLYYDD